MLRDYQIDICSRVSEAFDKHRSVMVQMPTGTGKTVVLAELVKQFLHTNTDCTVVIVAHRRELVEQIRDCLCAEGAAAQREGDWLLMKKMGKSLVNWEIMIIFAAESLIYKDYGSSNIR